MSNQYISREIYNENLKDKLTQSPFEKYQKYGRFPFKFIITCSLVFLTSLQVIFLTEYYSFNNAFQVQSWTYLLLDTDSPQDNVEQYHMIEEFQESIQSTLDTLEQIDDKTIQTTKLLGNVTLNINYNYPFDIFKQEKQFSYPITLGEDITEPFNISDFQSIKNFWMNAFAMTMKIENIQVYYGSKKMCWDVIIKYSLTDYGYIEAEIESRGGVCAFQTDDDSLSMVGNEIFQDVELGWDAALLQLLIIVLSLTQMILGFKYIFEVIQLYTTQIYQRQRKQRQIRLFRDKKLDTLKMIFHDQRPWDQLRFSEKLLFFDSFLPLTIIGNIFQLIASCVILIEGFFRVDELSDYDEVLGGFGCFFAWIALLKFLDYSDELHMTASVLEKSIIPLLMATLNFVPVFFGYTFLGMCIFSQTGLFSSLSSSTTVLIALIYGDSISDVIRKSAKGVNIITSMLFTCSYILIFIFTVNNIMIALIKEQQDYKKNTLQREKEFENQLAVKNDQRLGQSIFGDLSNLSMKQKQFKQISQNDIDEAKSDNTFSMISEPINSKKMTFKQAAQLQILIKKFPQVTQQDIDQDLSARNQQEITIKNLNYSQSGYQDKQSKISQTIFQIKIKLKLIRKLKTTQKYQNRGKKIQQKYIRILEQQSKYQNEFYFIFMNPIKYQSLQSNPYFLQQVENFLKDSSSLIKKGAYRKVVQVLDSHNKKLKQIDCPLSTRLTIFRRLVYCSLQYFKQKINKGEINQGNTQLILWGRLYNYFQELHELMHYLKGQKKKMFFIQELIKSIIQAYIYRAYYFAKNNTVAMGVLSYHRMIDKWNFNAEKNPQICEYLGQHHLVSAGFYFNLNLFQNAQDEYYQALSYILMSFQFQYEQIVTLNQDVIQKKLKRIVQTLIICLFGLGLAAEQNKCYQLYYESLKTLTWIDQHFMNQSSFTQLLIGQLDQNKYHQYLRDQKEIKKALSMAIEINQKQEKQELNQDLVTYFDNILFKYTKGIYQNYYFVDRKQSLENQDTEQDIISPKLSGSQYLITKNSQFEQSQMSTLYLQSNSKIKKKLSEPSNSNGTHSTRIQTDFDISRPPVSPKQKTMPSKLEDITLNQFYDNIIEKSCKIEQLNEMNEKLIHFHHSEQAVGKIFDKDINLYRNNLQFKQFFGNITGRQLGKTLKIKQVVKEANNNVKTAQTIVDSQIFLKRKTDKPLMILNDQKKDMKSILLKQSDKLGLVKTVRTIKYLKPNSPNIETEVAPEVVFAKNKEIIRTLMDEKEKEIQIPNPRLIIKKRTTHQSASSLLARLLAMNDGLAKSTENISQKRPQNIKSLIDISRKKIRDSTNQPSSNTYRENSKDRSQIM